MKKTILIYAAILMGIAFSATGCDGTAENGATEQYPSESDTLSSEDSGSATEEPHSDVTSEQELSDGGYEQIGEPEISGAPASEEQPPQTEPSQPEDTSEIDGDSETSAAADYSSLIIKYDNEFLGLPSPDKVYIFQDKGEQIELDGEALHAVSCYDEHEGTLYFMCDYYIAEDGSRVYRYYEAEDRYALLPESNSYTRLDPTSQDPNEIFAQANEVYAVFTGREKPELAGEQYYEKDGMAYVLISDERFDTKEKILNALSCYFSDDIINTVMSEGRLEFGENGEPYYLYSPVEPDPSYRRTDYELTTLDGDRAVFTGYSVYEYEAGAVVEKEITCSAEKIDGAWKFTEFTLPY